VLQTSKTQNHSTERKRRQGLQQANCTLTLTRYARNAHTAALSGFLLTTSCPAPRWASKLSVPSCKFQNL